MVNGAELVNAQLLVILVAEKNSRVFQSFEELSILRRIALLFNRLGFTGEQSDFAPRSFEVFNRVTISD